MKKIITLLIDSLMPDILEDCIRHRTVPALQFLKDKGRYWPNCVTVFPTMTASVDSSLVTGVYPNEHKVPGLIWYDPRNKEIINYLNDWKCIWKLGLTECTENVIYNLNEKHLSSQVSTIFEELAKRGKTSGSINAIVHRGRKKHRVTLPFPLNLLVRSKLLQEVSGPDIMTLGDMVEADIKKHIPDKLKNIGKYCGVNDPFAVHAVRHLIGSKNQPDFMLVYFPDNDHEIHKTNPAHAEKALIKVDGHIQDILNAFDSWEEAVNECVFVVISDHGQTRIEQDPTFSINLDHLLQSFKCLQLGKKVTKDHDLVAANNERMAYIYPLQQEKQHAIINQLLSDSRLDIVAWKENNGVRVSEGGSRKEMYFEPEGDLEDIYGRRWNITGEWSALDLSVNAGIIKFRDYPDALSRLYGSLYSQDIPMIVITARPRYELESLYYPTHLGGGSHGSLHKYDSTIPLIVAGSDMPLKEPPRLVDFKEFIIKHFEV
jgi:hypothetical protein